MDTSYKIYTDRPLEEQMDMHTFERTFKNDGTRMRWMAYILNTYENAIKKGRAYINVAYTSNQFAKMKVVTHISGNILTCRIATHTRHTCTHNTQQVHAWHTGIKYAHITHT